MRQKVHIKAKHIPFAFPTTASVPGDHNVSAVLKLDIERHECRAIAGSPEAFANPRMFIAYMSMEWAYK